MFSKKSSASDASPAILNQSITARTAPFGVYILFLALAGALTAWFTSLGLDARWIYALRVATVALLLLLFAKSYHELNWSQARLDFRSWLLSIAFGVIVFLLWILPWPHWAVMQSDGAGFSPLRADSSLDSLQAAIRWSGAALVVPVMEELFWRSFLLRWIKNQDFLNVDPAKVGWFAFVVVAVLFGLEHSLWLAGLLAGVAYNGLYMLRKTLWAPIVAHAVTNAMLGIWVIQTGNWQYW